MKAFTNAVFVSEYVRGRDEDALLEIHRSYGPMWTVAGPGGPQIHVDDTDPRALHTILSTRVRGEIAWVGIVATVGFPDPTLWLWDNAHNDFARYDRTLRANTHNDTRWVPYVAAILPSWYLWQAVNP